MAKYVYGLDLSLACTGVTIYDLDSKDYVYIGSFNTEKIKKQKGLYHNAIKLKAIADYFNELRINYPPHLVTMERGFSRFPTATQVIYRVHGLVNYLFHDVEQIYYPPKTVKEAIYKGDATKKQVQEIIIKKYDYLVFDNEDESDSFAVVLTYLIKNDLIVFEKPEVKPKKKTTKKKVVKIDVVQKEED